MQNNCEVKRLEKIILVSVLIVVAVCLLGMIIVMCQFYNSIVTFQNNYTMALNQIGAAAKERAGEGTNMVESIDQLITHMENMQEIQKSGLTNDLMSFIYGVLSTIMVGLCAGFVVKCEQLLNEAQKTAEQAGKDANQAKKDAQDANEKAMKTEDNAKQAEDNAKQAKESEKRAADALKEIEGFQETINQMRGGIAEFGYDAAVAAAKVFEIKENLPGESNGKQSDAQLTILLLSITRARMIFLSGENMHKANDCCFLEINQKMKEMKVSAFERERLARLQSELKVLRSDIDKYGRRVDKELAGGELKSKKKIVSNCGKWIDEAIALCDSSQTNLRK